MNINSGCISKGSLNALMMHMISERTKEIGELKLLKQEPVFISDAKHLATLDRAIYQKEGEIGMLNHLLKVIEEVYHD